MPEPLTLDQLNTALAATEKRIEKHIDDVAKRLDDFVETYTENHAELVAALADHTKRLERIENILWDGHRVAEIERRLLAIAETVGRADLATPITRPIGS